MFVASPPQLQYVSYVNLRYVVTILASELTKIQYFIANNVHTCKDSRHMTDAGSARVDPNNLFRVCLRTARAATEGNGAEGLMTPEGRRQAAPGLRR